MNDYRITYTTEAGDSFDSIITERTEAAARKFFTSMNKGLGFTVTNIELHHENTCATKQQERDTLAAIQKMVEELGPQSYLATAFEGCFEDAESNIENDFGDSYKRRCESLEQKLDETDETIEQLKNDIKLLSSALENERTLVKTLYSQLEQQTVSSDDIEALVALVHERQASLDEEVKKAAARIVENACEPESAEFKSAVSDHRAAKRAYDKYAYLLERVTKVNYFFTT